MCTEATITFNPTIKQLIAVAEILGLDPSRTMSITVTAEAPGTAEIFYFDDEKPKGGLISVPEDN